MFHLSGDLLPLDSRSYKVDGLSCDLGFLCVILSSYIMVVLFFGHCVRWVTRPYGCGMAEVASVVMRLFDSQSRQRQRILSSSALVTVENGASQVGKKLCSVDIHCWIQKHGV